jgi:hypothetical protein
MGFDFDGDFAMSLKDPDIKVTKQKLPQGECFVVEAEKNPPQTFKTFEDVINYFDHYPQPELDKERD